jgi:cytochrome c-type biogenesis protein CcmF
MTVPIMASLLFLVGVGPLLPWGRPDRDRVLKRLIYPGIGLVVALIAAVAFGTRNVWALLAFGFAGFSLVGNLGEFGVGMRARMQARGENVVLALIRLMDANRRRYGGYIAHLGVVAVAVGITASSTFRTEHEATLTPGDTMTVGSYVLRLDDIWGNQEPHRFAVGATMQLVRDGRVVDTIEPRLNFYPTSDQPITTPAVRSSAKEDLYLTLMAFEQDGSSATIRGIVEPLVGWIWIGGFIVALGALLSLSGSWKTPERERPVRAARRGSVTTA